MTASLQELERVAVKRTVIKRTVLWEFAALLTFVLIVAIGQWRMGAWNASYGAYPDEPSHFMGGLMIRDYLVTGSGSPIGFARNYYLFQPYFAIGFWPPVFYVIEGLWMLVAGYSRVSMMILAGGLSTLVALLMFAAMRRWVGGLLALIVAAAFLTVPTVQWSSSVVMTDMCVALFCLATTLAVGRYFETGTWRWAILTGLLASFALLTKYLAAFVFLPPMLLLLLERRWDLLRNVRTWGMVAVLAGLCGPWIFWSRKFALIGFDLNPDNLWRRLGQVFVVLHADLGSVLSVLAILTVIWTVWYWRRLTATQRLLCLQLPCVVAFVYAGPSGIEQRHFMPGYPGLLAVIAMAIAWAGSQKRLLTSIAMVAIAAVVVMRCASDRTGILPGDVPRTLAHDIWSNWKSGAIVVPATMEGPAIAELASAEPERSRMLLVRPSKLLARMNWTGTQYQLLVSGVDDLKTIFDRYPINTIIFATYPGQPELPHDQLLRRMVASDSRWQLERRYTEKGGGVWEAYRRPDHSDTDTDALVSFMRARMRAMQ